MAIGADYLEQTLLPMSPNPFEYGRSVMSRRLLTCNVMLGLLLGLSPMATVASTDLVFAGGHIYTADPANPRADAVVVRNGEIIHVGSMNDASAIATSDANWIDISGKMLLPGFHDAHVHTRLGGRSLTGCDVASAGSLDQLSQMLRLCFSTSEKPWLVAEGLNLGFFGPAGPMSPWIDALSTTKPVLLRASDGHSVSINSMAMRVAGITAKTLTPVSGVIERDSDGSPTGTLRESAMDLVERHVPAESFAERREMMQIAVQEMNRFGITSAFDAWVGREDIDIYRDLDRGGALTVRIRAALAYGHGALFTLDSPQEYERLVSDGAQLATENFKLGAVKLFIDGVLEGETAALVSPYLSEKGGRGDLTYTQAELNSIVIDLSKRGVQVYTHAVGDGGVRSILDAFEAAQTAFGKSDLRNQISHLQLIHPDDYSRFSELGVVANFQALWALPDEWIMNLNLPVVGMERVQRMYPIASLSRAGATIVGGSDWNVSSLNPLEAIEVGLLRQDWTKNDRLPDGATDQIDTLNPDERVDLDTMLRAYTVNAAWAMHQDTITGSLMRGKRADLVVLSKDLFAVPPQKISTVFVERTYMNGNLVYESGAVTD